MIVAVNGLLACAAVAVLALAHHQFRRAQKYFALARQMSADALEAEAAAARQLREARAAFDSVVRVSSLQVTRRETDFDRVWRRWKGGQA